EKVNELIVRLESTILLTFPLVVESVLLKVTACPPGEPPVQLAPVDQLSSPPPPLQMDWACNRPAPNVNTKDSNDNHTIFFISVLPFSPTVTLMSLTTSPFYRKQLRLLSTMESARILLRNVALEAGVSVATVSRALRNDREVSRKTAQHIQSLARRLGYRPDPALASLAAYRSSKNPPHRYGKLAVLAHWDKFPL